MKPERFKKFFSDLYRDLVDRRLLVPLVALAVAIIAVPMLLSSSAEPPVVPAASGADLGDPTALDAAVMVSDTGVRDYRKRLARLQSKNPFEQQFAEESTTAEGGTEAVTGSGLPDSGTPTTGSTSVPSTGSSSTGSVEITGGPPSVDPGPPTVDPGPPSTDPDDEPEATTSVRVLADRVDVKVGPVGDAKLVRDVRHLDFLPSDKTPIAAFLGLAGPNRALFSINPAVIDSSGEGSCTPKKADKCEYLTLKVGQERIFHYGFGPDAETYVLKLVDTNVVRIPDPSERESDEDRETDETDDSD